MALKAKFTRHDIRLHIAKERERIVAGLVEIFKYVGEQFVARGRDKTRPQVWQDQTGNLRQSIGYVVLLDGKVIHGAYPPEGEARTAFMGMLSGMPRQPNQLTLIGMVAMEYASYLEAMGYDVITSSEQMALVDITRMVRTYAAGKGVKIL